MSSGYKSKSEDHSRARENAEPRARRTGKRPAEGTDRGAPTGATRRDFLVSTAAAGAGLLFAAKTVGQEAPAPAPAIVKSVGSADDLNIALIGLGAQGMVLMDALLRIPGIRFKAVCDIWDYSRKRGSGMLKKYGHQVNAYVDYQELLDKETDLQAAVVATPDFVHAEHSIACLNKGLHVYCEKEMSNSLEKAKQMVLTARQTGKLLQIGHQRRSNPRYLHAINLVIRDNRLLGRVTQAYAQWNRAKSEDLAWPRNYEIDAATLQKYGYDSMLHFRNWRWYRKYGGGPIVDLGSHQIDIFTWVFGVQPQAVSAAGGIDYYKTHEWYDNVMAIYEYNNADGVSRAFYQVLTTTSNGGFYETFMGEDGTLVISEVPQRGNHLLREAHAREWEPFAKEGILAPQAKAEPPTEKPRNVVLDVRVSAELGSWPLPVQLTQPAHQPHLENFFDAVRSGTPLNCPAEIGYETAVAVLKVNEAVEAGHKLAFAPEEFNV
jgi:predicted dehydrogenase